MKTTLKEFLAENVDEESQFYETKKEIAEWLKKMGIRGWSITEEIKPVVNIDGDVLFVETEFEYFKVRFGYVKGDFVCANNNRLLSLKGAPETVGGNFNCQKCPSLESLKYGPKQVDGSYSVSGCTSIKSLKGMPKSIPHDFYCSGCKKLKDMTGGPEFVGRDCNIVFSFFKTLKGSPKIIGGDFNASHNPDLKTLEGCPERVEGDFNIATQVFFDSFENINKYIKYVGGEFLYNRELKSHVLGLLLIKGIKEPFEFRPIEVRQILNKHLKDQDIFTAQQELIDAGYEKFAQL